MGHSITSEAYGTLLQLLYDLGSPRTCYRPPLLALSAQHLALYQRGSSDDNMVIGHLPAVLHAQVLGSSSTTKQKPQAFGIGLS